MEEFKVAPCHIMCLLEINSDPDGPSNDHTATELSWQGLVLERSGIRQRWSLTERGEKWLEMLLSTPLPVSLWMDPRTVPTVDAKAVSTTSVVSE